MADDTVKPVQSGAAACGAPAWRLGPGRVWSGGRVWVLGVLNVTPDSFSDGGAWDTVDAAARAAVAMVQDGADGVDVGGESTRPGAASVPADEQIRRVVPVIRAVRAACGDTPVITIDTTLAPVAAAALDAGADAVNDVSGGLDDPALLPLIAARGCGVVLMHRPVRPAADRYSTHEAHPGATRYGRSDGAGVVDVVAGVLAARIDAALAAGVDAQAIVVDPGLGFGKSVEDNLRLIAETPRLCGLGRPVMSALSRKSFTARAAGLPDQTPPRERVHASVGLTLAHVQRGARIVRVHDVAPHVAALRGIGCV